MAFIRSSAHRRRSRSASTSSPTARRSPDDSLKTAAKRAYPIYAFGPSHTSLPHKWDVDAWRRGKRRRRDIPSQEISMDFSPEQHDTTSTIAPSTFVFSTTSADFNIFPKSGRSSRRRAGYSPSRSNGELVNSPNQTELTRLRSTAFWELHRNVAENGEGFIQRMRDYEHLRSCQVADPTRRNRKCGFHPQTTRNTSYIANSDESDDNEDIQIFAGELPIKSDPYSPHHEKRAGSMDVPYHSPRDRQQESQETSVLAHQIQSSPSVSEGGGFTLPSIFDASLSLSAFSPSSTAPSSLSSTIQSQRLNVDSASSSFSLPPSISPPVSASSIDQMHSLPSDKAVSEITLALANGAGGINDYSHLQNFTNFQHMDGGEPGELWH
ncbi:hypothetical protein D9756_003889 [Leucocoprinus leucothites]|uniref:Uncharacterized protein n=1 Tax=Leucocoprinus leucothites TaxID=201217 RepID=A0A8H5LDN8_9AGAR|nr:hypothetical protein D9756_003889 [Leucoagaricus leucothites]